MTLELLRSHYSELLAFHTGRRRRRHKSTPGSAPTPAAQAGLARDDAAASERRIVELVRGVAELIVYGEQNDLPQFFDYLCEKNMVALLVDLARAPKAALSIQVQVVQTLAILVQNCERPTSLFYLLSNNYLNELLLHRKLDLGQEDLCVRNAFQAARNAKLAHPLSPGTRTLVRS